LPFIVFRCRMSRPFNVYSRIKTEEPIVAHWVP
jgi:hypothetical protein